MLAQATSAMLDHIQRAAAFYQALVARFNELYQIRELSPAYSDSSEIQAIEGERPARPQASYEEARRVVWKCLICLGDLARLAPRTSAGSGTHQPGWLAGTASFLSSCGPVQRLLWLKHMRLGYCQLCCVTCVTHSLGA